VWMCVVKLFQIATLPTVLFVSDSHETWHTVIYVPMRKILWNEFSKF